MTLVNEGACVCSSVTLLFFDLTVDWRVEDVQETEDSL